MQGTIEKFPLSVKEIVTTTYMASGWIAVQRLFRNMGWDIRGISNNEICWNLAILGRNLDRPFH